MEFLKLSPRLLLALMSAMNLLIYIDRGALSSLSGTCCCKMIASSGLLKITR